MVQCYQSISPGAVRTDMLVNAGFSKELLDKALMLHPKDVGDSVIYALSTPPGIQVCVIIINYHIIFISKMQYFYIYL